MGSQTKAIQKIAEKKPLVHPGVFSMVGGFDLELAPPDHLRELYGDVYRALNPDDYPDAPRKLCYILPREHGKSSASIITVLWAILRDPNIRVLLMSESSTQANNKLREITQYVEELAPEFGRTIETSNRTELTLEREANHDVPTVKSCGVESGVTGGHFDYILMDDIVSYKSQRTNSRREKLWSLFQERLNLRSGSTSTFVVIGTRKHQDDLYSKLLSSPAWDVTKRPAIEDPTILTNKEHDILTDRGNRYNSLEKIDPEEETVVDVDPHRDVNVLWPERWPLDGLIMDYLGATSSGESSAVWRRENLCEADALQGQILGEGMLSYVDELPDRELRWVAALDPAVEADPEKAAREDYDYWAVSVVAYDPFNDQSYVVDVRRSRGMTMERGIAWLAQVLEDYPQVPGCYVESNQAQRWLVQTARDKGLAVQEVTSSGGKEDRILSMSARFESGKANLVGDHEDWLHIIDEWVAFPGNHDDMLDSMELALSNVGPQRRAGGEEDNDRTGISYI